MIEKGTENIWGSNEELWRRMDVIQALIDGVPMSSDERNQLCAELTCMVLSFQAEVGR